MNSFAPNFYRDSRRFSSLKYANNILLWSDTLSTQKASILFKNTFSLARSARRSLRSLRRWPNRAICRLKNWKTLDSTTRRRWRCGNRTLWVTKTSSSRWASITSLSENGSTTLSTARLDSRRDFWEIFKWLCLGLRIRLWPPTSTVNIKVALISYYLPINYFKANTLTQSITGRGYLPTQSTSSNFF